LSQDGGERPRTPFFVREGEQFIPTKASRGYWSADSLNGRVVGGLLGFALEEAFGEPDFIPARFCVDLLRLPPMAPLRVESKLARAGGRLKLADAELFAGETLIARANCLFLRKSADTEAPTWHTPAWDAPSPHELITEERSLPQWELRPIPSEARERPRPPSSALQPASGGSGSEQVNRPVLGVLTPFEARQAWTRETRELVGGYAHTPFTRVAAASDFASPLANSSESSIDFINTDITVYLHRLPAAEWLGFDLVKHHASDGIAIGECWLYDEAGALGTVTVAALAQRRR
jgi:acyl-CoA thioesterase